MSPIFLFQDLYKIDLIYKNVATYLVTFKNFHLLDFHDCNKIPLQAYCMHVYNFIIQYENN